MCHPQDWSKGRHFSAPIAALRMSWSFLLEQICSVQGPVRFSPGMAVADTKWVLEWKQTRQSVGGSVQPVAAVVLQRGLPESPSLCTSWSKPEP